MKALKDKNLYYVGGCVRDEILGEQSVDTDLCYEGNAIEFGNTNYSGHLIKTNPDFGTIRLRLDNREIDIASTREETYPRPGHLPVVKNIGCPLADDLKRRDFTINAMAKNTVTGEIYDPFDGKSDINKKLLRILHENSFKDDPTRIIRGLKFSVRFGFELEERTKELREKYLANINYDMSYHRLKKELVETFNLNNGKAFDIFIKDGLYKLLGVNQIAPDIKGEVIQEAIKKNGFTPWIIYMSFFNPENLPLTRQEKRIKEWTDRLKNGEHATNNTPKESICIYKLLEGEIS